MANDSDNFDIPDEIETFSSNKFCYLRNFSMSDNILQSNKGSVKLEDKEAFNLSSRSCSLSLNARREQKSTLGVTRSKKKYSKFMGNKKNWNSIVTKRNTIFKNEVLIASRSILRNRQGSVSSNSPISQNEFFKSNNLSLLVNNNISHLSKSWNLKEEDSEYDSLRIVTMKDVMAE